MKRKELKKYSCEEAVSRLLDSYEAYYNVHKDAGEQEELVARCDFFQRTEGSMIVKNDVSWQYNSEEFLYLFQVKVLTLDLVRQFIQYSYDDGYSRMNIGPRHMFSYITPVIICESADSDALKELKRCKIYKSFRFSLHGWMEVHTAVLEVNNNAITTNLTGRSVGKVLKNVLFNQRRRLVK